MRDPFIRADRAMIRRLGRYTPAVITGEDGVKQPEIPAIWVNSEKTGALRQAGKGSGGRDFKASAKRLRVLTEQVEGVSKEWTVEVGGVHYFLADYDHQDGGSTVLYLAPLSDPPQHEDSGNVWR